MTLGLCSRSTEAYLDFDIANIRVYYFSQDFVEICLCRPFLMDAFI